MTQISQNIDNIVFVLTAILFTKEDIYIYIYIYISLVSFGTQGH